MKQLFNLKKMVFVLMTFLMFNQTSLFAQTPSNGIFFQAVARDQFANPAKDRKIYVQSSIIQSTATGTKVLIEEHQTTTDGSGVFSISVGQGTRTGGTVANLDKVEWARGPYYLNLKIAITPIAPIANWNYTKDWIDLGSSPFGTVPYALYSGSSGALDDKLSVADTAKMLAIYAKAQVVNSLSTQVSSKLSASDTTTMLAPYAKMVSALVESNITSLTAASVNAALNSKVNIADSTIVFVTPLQLASKTFDSTTIYNQLGTKLNKADTSTLSNRINLKANTADLTSGLALKLNITDTSLLLQKADTSTLSNRINLKANTTDLTSGLALKLNAAEKAVANGIASLDNNSKVPANQIPVVSFQSANVVASQAAMLGLSSAVVGSIAIRTDNNRNYVLSGSDPAVIGNWVELAVPTSVTTVNGIPGAYVTLTTNEIGEGTINKYYTDARVRNAISATGPLNFNASTGTLSMTAASGSANGYLSSTDFNTFNNKQNTLTAGVDYATPSGNITGNAANVTGVVSIVNGGTGTTTATGALTNLGAEATANKSTATDLGNTNPSDVLFPSQKAVKTYVDLQNANAGVADLSITNAKLAGSITADKLLGSIPNNKLTNSALTIGTTNIALGATTTSLAGLSSVTATNLVGALTGDVTGNVTGNLIGDVTGNVTGALTGNASTATKLAATKNINGVAFDGSANITIAADANTLTGSTLASNVLNSSLISVGTITSGTWSGTEIAIAKGGTGATTAAAARTNLGLGTLATKSIIEDADVDANAAIAFSKLNITKANITGLGVQEGLTAGSGISINAGTISATGLTTNNLASNAAITNAQLANSTTTLGSTTLTLGATTSSLAGLNTVTATNFVGALTGDVTGNVTGNASTATKLAATKNINGVAFDGSANITIASDANTLTGTTLANNVLNSSLTSIGTITSGTWSGTEIAIAKGGTGATTAAAARTNLGLATLATKSIIEDADVDANAAIAFSKLNITKANITGLGVQEGLTAGSGISINAGTISATGLTASNLSSSAGITVGQLATSTTTLGSTTMTLGGTVTSVTGLSSVSSTGFTGALTGNATTATALVTGRTISLTGDVTYTSPTFDGSGDITAAATLAASGVNSGTYGSSTAIPVLTIDTKGRVTSASTVGIIAGVNSLNYTSTTSYAAGGTISGTSLTLTAADGTNPGLISTGAQTIAGAKTFNSDLVVNGMTVGKGGGNVSNNTAVGFNALTANVASGTPGINNTALGYNSLSANTTGGNNVAIGNAAGSVNVGGSNNVFIGNNANAAAGLINNANAIAIGSNAIVDAPNKIQLGDQNITAVNTSGTITAAGFSGPLSGNATTATALATGRTIALTGDLTYTSPAFDGSGNVTAAATLAASGVASGTYGSSTAIPTFTVDSKGRITAASTVGITAGVSSLNYTTANSYAAGGTISGTSLTLAPADGTNPGLISTGAQTIAGAKTFSSDVTATNFIGNATTATTAGNITATSNTSLTSLANLTTVGTITSGTWSASTIDVTKGGTGATTAADARTNLGLGSLATKSTIANADVASGAAIDFAKLNITKANITSLGVQEGLTAGSGISISAGTISATGLTTSNLSSTAGITVDQLATKTTTLGSTTLTLGGTVNSLTGLSSVSSNGFTGALTGNASTATKLAATVNINGVAFDGSTNITIATDANTLTGTTLANNIVSSSLTSVGTITSGTWSGSVIGSNVGGAGTVSGIMKANGTGIVSTAVAGTDYQSPYANLTNIGSLSNSAGYLKNVGSGTFTYVGSITDADLSTIATAGKVSNSATTATASNTANAIVARDVSGNFTAGTITGTLSGTANLANTLTTGRTISTTGDITYTSGAFDGSASVTGIATLASSGVSSGTYGSATLIPTITVDAKGRLTSAASANIIANAGTLTGTTLNATVINSSLTGVATITSGTWNGSTIGVAYGGTGVTTSTGSGSVVLSNSPSLTSPNIGAANGTSLNLSSTLAAGASTLSSTLNVAGATTLSSSLTAGTTTLTSLSVTNNETVGGTLGVTGATTLSSLTASGTSTLTTLTTTGAATFSSTVKITTGAGLNKVLTSDASGNATWKSGYTAITTKTADYTLTLDDNFLIVGSTATTGKTFTLPTAVGSAGKEFTIKNLSAFSITIASSGGKLVQDNTTTGSTNALVGIEPSNNWIKVISDGTDWIVFRALF
jgi:hypothetical protein